MDPRQTQLPSTPTGRKTGYLIVGCGLPLVLILLLLALGLAWSSSVSRGVDSELERLRAAGHPASVDELNRFYTVPAGKTDITGTLLTVFRMLDSPEYRQAVLAETAPLHGDTRIPPAGETWEHEASVAEFLKQQAAALDLLHAAVGEDTAARFPINFAAGTSAPLLHLNKLREAARLLALEASWKAYHGDVEGAANSLHAIFCLAEVLDQEPLFASQLTRMGVGGMGREAVRRLSPRIEFSDADLDRFQQDLRRPRYEVALHRSFAGERVLGKDAFQGMPLWQLTRGADYTAYLQTMARLQQGLQQPWPQPLLQMRQVEAEWRSGRFGKTQVMTGLAVPAWQLYVEAAARNTSLNHAAEAALAAQRFRIQHNRLPETLQELAPDYLPRLPIDPYTGEGQRMLRIEEGILIYSVGLDGVDNGGKGDEGGKPDVVFELKLR